MAVKFSLKTCLLTASVLFNAACASHSPQTIDLDGMIAEKGKDESNFLRYFSEINVLQAHKQLSLEGEGVRVTIMGEQVDASHPDLRQNVVNQFNAFITPNKVARGRGNQPVGEEFLSNGDGHGTHIAGTIAAACDGVGVQGVACKSTLDVYDLGAYGNAKDFPRDQWNGASEEVQFLSSFATAIRDVAKRGESRITTGSFNLESPAILTKPGGPLQGKSIDDIIKMVDGKSFEKLARQGLISFANPDDLAFLNHLKTTMEEDVDMLPVGVFFPKSKEWSDIENALSEYQSKDGVYIVTESNNKFDNRTSVLNAMPTLSTKVSKDLWISVVMAARKVTDEGEYITPINTCGKMAQDYCILTPSYYVLSTMTERVAEKGEPIIMVGGRKHQVYSGHSMGAPMVAAGLALMQEYNRKTGSKYTMKDLVRIMKDAANKNFPGYDPELHGVGMLDVGAALRKMGAPLPNTSQFRAYTCGGSHEVKIEFVEDDKEVGVNIANVVFEGSSYKLKAFQNTDPKSYTADQVSLKLNGRSAVLKIDPQHDWKCVLNP